MEKNYMHKQAFEKAILFGKSGAFVKEKEIYECILEEDKSSFDAYNLLGLCHYKLKDFENSIVSIKKALELNPSNLDFYINLANSYCALKQYEKAKLIYKKLIEKNQNFAIAYHALGLIYKQNKDYEKALEHFKKAIKINREFYICYYDMAITYEKLHKHELWFFYLQKTIKINPDFYDALFSIAQYYRKTKNEKKLEEYLLKTLEKLPEHPGANHLLASLHEETSSTYSLEYARDLFDRYADHFEEHLVNTLKYKVPSIIKDKLQSLNSPRDSKILDLGCGTGLLGKTIVDRYPNLVGVDISSKMIEETRKKEIYTNLHVNDIDNFLLKNIQEFDLIIAPDVFIYIADLETIFSNIKKSLSINGYFIFTIEPLLAINTEKYQLEKNGRVSHAIEYVKSLCENIGFDIIENEEIILREENKIGQKGAIFILKLFPQ
jgi:predicted TPR repeat methyltransferase